MKIHARVRTFAVAMAALALLVAAYAGTAEARRESGHTGEKRAGHDDDRGHRGLAGAVASIRADLTALQGDVQAQQAEIDRLSTENDTLRSRLDTQEGTLSTQGALIAGLVSAVAQQGDEIAALAAQANQGGVPVGTILADTQAVAPDGFLPCDGRAVSRTDFADLFSVIGTTYGAGDGVSTFNVPDLRGQFVRGWDDGRGVDPGRMLGSAQLDAFQDHKHNTAGIVTGIASTLAPIGAPGGSQSAVIGIASILGPVVDLGPAATPAGGPVRSADETRPANVALRFLIKH